MAASKFLSLTGLDTYDAKIKDWVEKKGYTTPEGHNHDGRYYTETEVNNLLKDYLKLAGGTMTSTAQIQRPGTSTSWYLGRSNAMIKTNSYSGYNAIASMKTTDGDWSMGVYSGNKLYFTYVLDTDFNNKTNNTAAQIIFNPDGTIIGSPFKGAGVSAAGTVGLVPQPAAGKHGSYLRGDGTWSTPTNTTYGAATQSAAGLMSAADKKKLDGIASGANAYSLPLAASGTRGGIQIGYSANGANIPLQLSSEKGYVTLTKTSVTTALGYTPPTTNTTYGAATQSTAGLMSADDKKKLDGIAAGANNYTTITATNLEEGTSNVTDNTEILTSYASDNGFADTNAPNKIYKRDAIKLYNYIKGKTDNVYAAKSHGNHVPTTQTANNSVFLRNDNTWQTVTPANIGAASSSHNHAASEITSGVLALARIPTGTSAGSVALGNHTHNYAAASHGNHVPATQTANNAIFLRNDNTWQTVTPANIGAATSSHNHDGTYAPASHTHSYAASSHNHAASNITSGVLALARIPTGTSAGSVALGNHTHSYAASNHNHDGTYAPASHTHSYAAASHTHAAGDITSGVLALARIPTGTSAGSVALGNHGHSGYMTAGDTSHGTHVTTGAQTWSGTKTFASEVILNGGGTQTDICSGIAAAFKTKRIMSNQIIADSIILGASSGTASNKDLTIQKYGKITSTAPDSLTTLLTFDTKGRIRRTSGGSWISARDNTIIMQEQTNSAGASYNPIIGTKTQAGFWSIGSCGGETLYLSYDTDENYNAGNNTSSTILFPTAGRTGTIALTADIPGAATQSAAGLMSAADKKKLDGIATGANNYTYTHPATHPVSIITGLATVATSGSYNDLSNKPTIPTSLPANGGNADTVDNKHASDFMAAGDTSHGTHITDGNQTWSGNKMFNGSISLNGTDLNLKTPSTTSNDSGDIVFTYGNGNEKCRIYTANEPTNGNGPYYRVKKTDGTSLYDGRLATIADIPGNATTSKAGLMSAADKTKLDGIDLSGGITKPDGTAGSLQEALNALKTLIEGKANSTHYHNASNINEGTLDAARIPNLAASKITSGTFATDRIPDLSASKITSGTFAVARIPDLAASKITSGTFAAARIPDLAASKITSGTLGIDRIPTGTSAGSVALGNHSHSGYMTAGDTSHGTHVTNDDQEWSGTKTFINGIRIGDDGDPSGNDLDPYRTIYFGDAGYVAIYESPSDALSLKGNVINLNTTSTHDNVIIPSIEGYSVASSSSWTTSSTMSSTYSVSTSYTNMQTKSATSSYSLNLYISGTSTYLAYTVPAGQTIRIDVGANYYSYMDWRSVYSGGVNCTYCGRYIDYIQCLPAPGWMPYMYVKFYLTTSSSSTTPISGAYSAVSMFYDYGYTSNFYNSDATRPSVQTVLEYTNTGSSSTTVYLRAQIYRDATSSQTCSGFSSGNWRFPDTYDYSYTPMCPDCESGLYNIPSSANNNSPGTFYHYFKNIITYRKYTIYKKNTFTFPAINKLNSKNAIINNGIINNYSNLFTGAGVTYTSSGFINSNKQLCYKFPDANSVFYADKDKLAYIIGGTSDIAIYHPNVFFSIDNTYGLQMIQGSSYYHQLNDATLKLKYSSDILTIDYDSIISNVNNDLEIGSSSYKCWRIYSNYFYGTVSSSSDERFKEWQSDIEIDFDKLKTIPKKIFKWKDSFLKHDDDLHIGTSAQAIRDIYPEIVHIYNEDKELCGPRDIYDPDAVLTVDYDKLGVIALAAIDKLHEENVQLKEESEQLKTRLDNLEAILKEKGIL